MEQSYGTHSQCMKGLFFTMSASKSRLSSASRRSVLSCGGLHLLFMAGRFTALFSSILVMVSGALSFTNGFQENMLCTCEHGTQRSAIADGHYRWQPALSTTLGDRFQVVKAAPDTGPQRWRELLTSARACCMARSRGESLMIFSRIAFT